MTRFAERGGWWVVGQFFLLGAVLAAPRSASPSAFERPLRWLGAAMLAAAAGVLAAGSLKLGRRLTPFPRPAENSSLVTSGIYGVVRHPLYCGVISMALGIASIKTSLWSLLAAAALAVLLNAKANREERWLSEKFPEYPAYRLRTRKLVPFIF